ncbi:MAG: beta-N-acetylhexosaminidase [Fimbriimonadaceae bacterium]|nr:beta-N-acetylhexosaminidase [Fimbriimonadaceae bacterium]QYK55585.1 MAG: beta-N-acetylhexosaminidase [Fimbriimonadaceae bacterium]
MLAAVTALALAMPAIIPVPLSVTPEAGAFTFDEATKIVAHGDLDPIADRLRESLSPATDFPLKAASSATKNAVVISYNPKLTWLSDEGYRLSVTPDLIEIQAKSAAGAFYGVQSLRQMLPSDTFRSAPIGKGPWKVPCVRIEDEPRFKWRGVMLDPVRHFLPKDWILKFIDLIALHKLNTLHLHLTDDQGWRMEIKRYPRLTVVGGWRRETVVARNTPVYDGKPHGGFYTQEDLREIVAYAKQRFVTVVPEIEMPGHASAAIAAYPSLGNIDTRLEVKREWGVSENIFNVEDSTIEFLQGVLEEVVAVFPSEFIHIGGDEAPKAQWKASPAAQSKMRALGLKDEDALQSWFIGQMNTWLTARGRRLIGWDEIAEGGLPPGVTVMAWRGIPKGVAAAKAGHDVVMAPTSHTYFDYYQAEPSSGEPLAIGGFTSLAKSYEMEPVPRELTKAQGKRVLGVQAQLWSEYMVSPSHVEYMAFPRLCSLAEVAWSDPSRRNFDDFLERLNHNLPRLAALSVNYRPLEGLPHPFDDFAFDHGPRAAAPGAVPVPPRAKPRGPSRDTKPRKT